MRQILMSDFRTLMGLEDWQKLNNLPFNKISPHIYIGTDYIDCQGEMILSEIIIQAFEDIRTIYGKPLFITSGYRDQEKQNQLIRQGYRAAVTSPHVRGYALDFSYDPKTDGERVRDICRDIRKKYHGMLRIGWRTYWQAGQNFIHLDCAPMAWAKLQDGSMPNAWRQINVEW